MYPRPLLPAQWEETDEGQIPPEGAGSVRMSPQPYDTRARVRGSLDGLLQVSLGRGPVRSCLAGEVSFKGNPFFVLRALPLMRVQTDGERPGR